MPRCTMTAIRLNGADVYKRQPLIRVMLEGDDILEIGRLTDHLIEIIKVKYGV